VKAVVTGGTGFVGSHLVERLLATGFEVVCYARNAAKADAAFGERPPRVVQGSLFDERALREALGGADLVFHVAGLTSAWSRRELFEVNEEATRRVVAAAAEAAPSLRRIVYVSSIAAAGPTTRGHQRQPDEPERPVTPYGASKLAGERAVRAGRMPWTIVRPPVVYGPRDVELLRVFRMAARGFLLVFGDGSQELSLIYAEDLARALIAAATSAQTVDRVYFAAHSDVVRQRAFATAVGRAVRPDHPPVLIALPAAVARVGLWISGTAAVLAGRRTVLTLDKANEYLAAAMTCSPAALEHDSGWAATYSLAAGLTKTVGWYREHRWL
jgi:nucleoside-diphosphate-sugar epimerase